MTTLYTPAVTIPPGEYLCDELEECGWTITNIIGQPAQTASETLNAKTSIAPDTALSLSEAFGTRAELWLNLADCVPGVQAPLRYQPR